MQMWIQWFIWAFVATLAVISLGGIPDDLRRWQGWMGSTMRTLSSWPVRASTAVLMVVVIASIFYWGDSWRAVGDITGELAGAGPLPDKVKSEPQSSVPEPSPADIKEPDRCYRWIETTSTGGNRGITVEFRSQSPVDGFAFVVELGSEYINQDWWLNTPGEFVRIPYSHTLVMNSGYDRGDTYFYQSVKFPSVTPSLSLYFYAETTGDQLRFDLPLSPDRVRFGHWQDDINNPVPIVECRT